MDKEKLKEEILKQTQGKLTDEQIEKILENVPLDTEITVTDNPFEMANLSQNYSETSNNYNKKTNVEVIEGDLIPGKETVVDGWTGYRVIVKDGKREWESFNDKKSNFRVHSIQIISVNIDEKDDQGSHKGHKTVIYLPTREYSKETFPDLSYEDDYRYIQDGYDDHDYKDIGPRDEQTIYEILRGFVVDYYSDELYGEIGNFCTIEGMRIWRRSNS